MWTNARTSTNNNSNNTGVVRWDISKHETIHSGHFMVSTFEAEAQDEDDNEIEMPDPDSAVITEINPQTDDNNSYLLPVPVKRTNSNTIIDISLTKLFKCMNLAYKQKLTSPKWNRFKGVRLRWKDKIRLNNLIWRCWHMQFVLKRNPLVCQFASPLDVDIHSKPEAVVLEGKYWKRQFDVIKAEYMKWRKFYRSKGLGNAAILDTVSEYDALDWSPANPDKSLMGIDDYFWTADTLFSTINNVPFPFPDPREIAKAGIADFIQPSLGPLQPNLDDFMNGIPFQELLNTQLNARLPSVPEENSDDIFKVGDYDFPAIMESEDMNMSTISSPNTQPMPGINQSTVCTAQYPTKLLSPQQHQNVIIHHQQNQQQPSASSSSSFSNQNISMTSYAQSSQQSTIENSIIIDHPKKRHLKDRSMQMAGTSSNINSNASSSGGSSSSSGNMSGRQFSGRRVPHNYDKTQPTHHQTVIYNQVMSQNQQQQQPMASNNFLPSSGYINASSNLIQMPNTSPIIQTTTNHYLSTQQSNNALNLSNTNMTPVIQQHQLVNYQQQQQTIGQQQQQSPQIVNLNLMQTANNNKPTQSSQSLITLLTTKSPSSGDSSGSMDNLQESSSYKSTSAAHQSFAYKPYPSQKSHKMSSTSFNNSAGYNQLSPSHMSSLNEQQQLNTKEMYRSKSLPLNSTLQMHSQKESASVSSGGSGVVGSAISMSSGMAGQFAVPRSATTFKVNRVRSRSNSVVIKQPQQTALNQMQMMQSATSEPVLSTLAQLLTTTNSNKQINQQQQQLGMQSSSSSFVSPPVQQLSPNSTVTHDTIAAQQKQQSPQQYKMQQQYRQSPLQKQLQHQSQPQSHAVPMLGSSSAIKHTINSPPTFIQSPIASSLSPELLICGDSSDAQPLSPGRRFAVRDTQRRAGHIHAEQKRRYNIKNGFDTLQFLIPQLQANPNAKLSKAAMLQKGADYIRQLQSERTINNEKMEILKRERDSLNTSLNHLHSVLPANGAPISRQKSSRVKELYNDYVRYRTLENWKFWILGLIFRPLFNSFNTSVSVANMDELSRTATLWVDQHCSLTELRPAVSNQLRYLSTTTDILSDPPTSLQDEVMKAIS